MTTPLFPSVIGHNVLDGGTDAQDGNAYPGPLLQEYAAAVVGAAGNVRRQTHDCPLVWWSPTLVNAAQQVTQSTLATAPADFDAVALVFFNADSSSLTVDSAAVSVTERSDTTASKTKPIIGGTEYNALASAGTQLGFSAVTFSGASSGSVPAGTLAAPGILVSDFMPLTSIPRVDNPSALPLVMARHYFNTRAWSGIQLSAGSEVAAFRTLIQPHEWYQVGQLSAPNGALDPSLFTTAWSGTDTAAFRGLAGFVFRLRRARDSFMLSSDSIGRGLGAGGDVVTNNAANFFGGWFPQAALDIQRAGTPVGIVHASVAGRTSTQYLTGTTALLSALKPTVSLFVPYTPNETAIDAATMSLERSQMLSFSTGAMLLDSQPVLVATFPNGGTNDANRLTTINAVRASSVPYIDIDAVTYDSGAASKWITGYALGDNTHPTATGYAVARTAGYGVISNFAR